MFKNIRSCQTFLLAAKACVYTLKLLTAPQKRIEVSFNLDFDFHKNCEPINDRNFCSFSVWPCISSESRILRPELIEPRQTFTIFGLYKRLKILRPQIPRCAE